jgi:uncharacterized protein (TIGR00369 family)
VTGGAPDPALATALLPPYARSLGMEVARMEVGVPVLAIDYRDVVVGRPGFVHGGAIGGLLEMAALTALTCELRDNDGEVRVKPINITVEYLRGAGRERTYAIGRVTRVGRRIANVGAECWQADRAKPVAMAWMNIRIAPRD